VLYRLLGSCCGYSKSRRIRPDTEALILAVHPDTVTPEEPAHADRHDIEPWFLDLEPLPAGLDLTWRADGRCREPGVPTWIFFPYRGDLETLRAARAICADCTVRQRCLDFALAVNAMGIWGGKTEQQRERMIGRRGGLEQPRKLVGGD
jgi:WhiB family redox-sensing transcriptional regulator